LKKSETTITSVKVADGMGQVLVEQKDSKGESVEFKETILKAEKGKTPTKVEREYTKMQSTKDDKASDGPLQGKTVIIEKKGKSYEFTTKDGQKVDGPAAAALAKDFGKKDDENKELEKLILPKGAVKVGESWKIEMAKIVEVFNKEGALEVDAAKSTGTGTLVKAYKKDGRQFGDMKFKLEFPLQTAGKGKEQLKFAAGAKIVMDMTFDVCIDGTSENGVMTMKMLMTGNGSLAAAPGAVVAMNVRMEGRQEQQDASKK
jgi:hypothetical protein